MPDLQESEILSKSAFPTALQSKDIRALWTKAMKDQSVFSAQTTSKEYLETVRELLADYQKSGGKQRTRMLMREKLEELGLLQREKDGSVSERMTNLGSRMRLDIIIDTNTKMAHAEAQKMTASDPVQQILRPAWELVRNRVVKQPRNWSERWFECAQLCNWQGVAKNTDRFVALTTSDIWSLLGNRFPDSIGCDCPPFWWGSSAGWKTVTRKDCIQLGIIEDEH